MPRRRRIVLAGLTAGVCALGLTVVALATTPPSKTRSTSTTDAAASQALGQAGAAPEESGTPAPAGPAGAAPARGTGSRTAATVAQAAPASVAYLRKRYGVTAAEAARRVALQESSTTLAAQLAGQFPGEYGGMWLDQTGGGVLTVAATQPDRLRASVATVPDAAHVRVVPVAHSLRELADAAGRVAGALGVTAGVDVVVDQSANAVIVLTGDRVSADDPRLASALAAAGVPARAQPRFSGRVVQKSCDPRYCGQAPMRGGIRLDVPRDDGTVGGCTSGFNVRSAKTGTYYVLTAGHCVLSSRHTHVDQTWHQYYGPKIPVTVEDANLEENAYPSDYAIMPFQTGAAGFWFPIPSRDQQPPQRNLVDYWCPGGCAGSHDVPITGYVAYSAIQIGWVVCATGSAYTPDSGETYVDSGAGTGYVPGTRCGEITSKTSGGIDVRICARPGDSGGPLFTEADGKALGILSHGDPGQGACTNPDEHNSYAPVSTILDRANSRTGGALALQLVTTVPVAAPVPVRSGHP